MNEKHWEKPALQAGGSPCAELEDPSVKYTAMNAYGMRQEVQDLIRICERLISFAHLNNGDLTDEECDVIFYYAKELGKEIEPSCRTSAPPGDHDGSGSR